MKMTIYVPDDLKKRMNKVKEANWSALACRAFESHLAEVAARKEQAMTTDEVVARLRNSQRAARSTQNQDGYKAGAFWAQRLATARQLELLAKDASQYPYDESRESPAHAVAVAVNPDEANRHDATAAFWGNILGVSWRAAVRGDYVGGFVDGALDVWDKVKDEL